MHHCEASPVTPLGVGVKKLRGNIGKDNDSMTSGSCGEIWGNSERRITRSFSRQVRGKLGYDYGRSTENNQVAIDLFKHSESGSRKRRVVQSTGQVRGASYVTEKDSSTTPRVRRGRQYPLAVNNEKDGKADECRQIVGNSKSMVTRSASRAMQGKTDLCGQMVERQSTRTSSRFLVRKAQSPKEKKEKLENNGLSNFLGNQPHKRMTRSSGASSLINHEKDGKADECRQFVGNSNRLVTPKAMQGKTDLCGQMVERRGTHTSSRFLARKAESPKAKKEKLENNDLSNCLGNQPQKRMTRSSGASSSIRLEEESRIRDINGTIVECHDFCRLDSELGIVSCDPLPLCSSPGWAVRKTQDDSGEDPKLIGVERNRRQTRLQGTGQGWTKEQEVALQNAYFTAKPSPHFWKKVAKLVPGKSAQDCFDKVNSNILTPPSTRPSSRAKKGNSPSALSFSGSELLKSAEKKSKKTGRAKQKSRATHRNVRHLLQKYSHVNQDSEADLFSVLEPTVNPSAEAFQLNSEQTTQKHKLVSSQNTNSLSAPSFSRSELFKSAEKKGKKTGRAKQKSHVARSNVKHLLQKSGHVNQDSEADLFSVLEPTVKPSPEAFQLNSDQTTPKHKLFCPGSSSRCRDSSSLSSKKRLSRFSGASGSPLTSPPVLKKVKNLALHEKYIDQLHMREAKRKVASARHLKAVRRQKNGEENPAASMKDVIRAAKDALFSDARNAIHKFHHSQANLMETFFDSEEFFCSDDETEETRL